MKHRKGAKNEINKITWREFISFNEALSTY
jgi:hypothetical protein